MSKSSKYENEFFHRAPDLTDDISTSTIPELSDSSVIFTSSRTNPYIEVPNYTPKPLPVPDKNTCVCHCCRNLVPISDDPFCPYCGNMLD